MLAVSSNFLNVITQLLIKQLSEQQILSTEAEVKDNVFQLNTCIQTHVPSSILISKCSTSSPHLMIIVQSMMEWKTEIEIQETVLNSYNSKWQHGTHSPEPEHHYPDHDGMKDRNRIRRNSVEAIQQQQMTAWHTLTMSWDITKVSY
jgi:hypothetical protein